MDFQRFIICNRDRVAGGGVKRGYRGYGKFQEENNDVIGNDENNYLVVTFELMFITRKPNAMR